MAIKQTRIFVPWNKVPFDQDETWAETVFGLIVKPVVEKFQNIEWFWFSRYIDDNTETCDISKVPGHFKNEFGLYKSIRFRYSSPEAILNNFEEECQRLIDQSNCFITDFRPYKYIADLADNRFLGGERSEKRERDRANLMVSYLCSVCRLVLHALEGPNQEGRFSFEHNVNQKLNPQGSSFQMIHHLFCNITEVPLRVFISGPAVGTNLYPPQVPYGEYKIKF